MEQDGQTGGRPRGTIKGMREITRVVSPSLESVMIFVLAFSLVAQALPVKGLSVSGTVESGEIIAHTSGRSMLDLGGADTHVTLKGFLNPDRHPRQRCTASRR
jgi:hypothetical protein